MYYSYIKINHIDMVIFRLKLFNLKVQFLEHQLKLYINLIHLTQKIHLSIYNYLIIRHNICCYLFYMNYINKIRAQNS